MKRAWSEDDLAEMWLLLSPERALLKNKTGATRLGFALLLKFVQSEGRFPSDTGEFPPVVVGFVAGQVEVDPAAFDHYPWEGATIKRHRAEIREWCGFREFTFADHEALKGWLIQEVIPHHFQPAEDKPGRHQDGDEEVEPLVEVDDFETKIQMDWVHSSWPP